jgi:hypothetical protein
MTVHARSACRRCTRPSLAIVALAVAVAMVASGCSKGAEGSSGIATPEVRPSSPARVTILSPRNGQVVQGSDVKIRFDLSGARIVSTTTTNIVPTKGHLHVYLDDQIVSMNFKLSGNIGDVGTGMHVLRVEFVASDHRPFDPRVFTAVTFEVRR